MHLKQLRQLPELYKLRFFHLRIVEEFTNYLSTYSTPPETLDRKKELRSQ